MIDTNTIGFEFTVSDSEIMGHYVLMRGINRQDKDDFDYIVIAKNKSVFNVDEWVAIKRIEHDEKMVWTTYDQALASVLEGLREQYKNSPKGDKKDRREMISAGINNGFVLCAIDYLNKHSNPKDCASVIAAVKKTMSAKPNSILGYLDTKLGGGISLLKILGDLEISTTAIHPSEAQ